VNISRSDSVLLLHLPGLMEAYCIYMGMSMTQMRRAGWTMLLNPSVVSPQLTVHGRDTLPCISYSIRILIFCFCMPWAVIVSQDYLGKSLWSTSNASNGMGRTFDMS
jgi:hypothetical protein